MSARGDILAAVHAALAGVAPMTEAPAAPRVPEPAPAELIELFCARVADYRAEVTRCSPAEVEGTVHSILAGASVVVPPALGLSLPTATTDDAESPLTASRLDEIDAILTRARVAIAETGTIVLDHTDDQGRRAISLVPDRHVCIVDAVQIVADVPDAVALLDARRPQTWISGPSATSDIELSRVEGVHGPRTLHVVLVG